MFIFFRLDRSILVLMAGFAVIVVLMITHVARMQSSLLEENALNTAQLLSVVINEVRGLYTSEVVNIALASGVNVTHNYLDIDNAIPLPATFSMRLGELIQNKRDDLKTRLYSAYPFPWREESGGLVDDFSKTAWLALSKDKSKPYIRFVETAEGTVLRYAIADVIRSGCVNCHNTHPQSPKRDWKTGDLRGILEINLPLESGRMQVVSQVRQVQWIYSVVGLLILAGIGYANYRVGLSREALVHQSNELKRANTRLKQLSEVDGLTGVSNRRHYDEQLNIELLNARRSGTPVSLLFIDIDYFKQYNDGYGHSSGDDTLRRVAKLAKSCLTRETDYIARYGGEEFVVLLPFTDTAGAYKIAEIIRQRVEQENIVHEYAPETRCITVSIGIASVAHDEYRAQELFKRADSALYEAKQRGRNRCVVDGQSFDSS